MKGPKLNKKERPSFPKKTTQDLQKQYQDYLRLNSGSKTKDDESTAKQFSEVLKEAPTAVAATTEGATGSGSGSTSKGVWNSGSEDRYTQSSMEEIDDRRQQWTRRNAATELIKAINYKLTTAHLDVDQQSQSYVSNDLLLIDISRVVMDFISNCNRQMAPPYSPGDGEHLEDIEEQ